MFLGNQSPFAEEFQFVYEHLLATKNVIDANDKFFHLLYVFCLSCQPTLAQRRVRLADLSPFERAVVVVKWQLHFFLFGQPLLKFILILGYIHSCPFM